MTKPTLPDPAADHFNYDELDEHCGCSLCVDYRTANSRYLEILAETGDLDWKDVGEEGRRRRRAHTLLLAASTRRDLYSELSFLTQEKRDSVEFMTWIQTRLVLRTDGWWANEGAKRTMGMWIEDWAIDTGRLPPRPAPEEFLYQEESDDRQCDDDEHDET